MTWWLIGILGYLAALGVVLALVGGVRRGDELHDEALRAELAGQDPESEPRDSARNSAPPRSAPRLRPARRAASS